MKTSYTSSDYLSPYTWRYGSEELRAVWSQQRKHLLWRRIWVALATVQADIGLVQPEQLAELIAQQENVDLARAAEIEADIRHDLMAEVRTYAEQCPVGGGVIHLGATSMDIEDNADALRIRDSLDVLITKLGDLLLLVAQQIEAWADQPTMAFTHLQPAEPTTIGYRLAQYGQDLLTDFDDLRRLRRQIMGKGFKGAAGTSASYQQLLVGTGLTTAQFESRVMGELGLRAFTAATQTAPRKQEYRVLAGVASMGQSLYKFAADLRLLQSPPIGEWAEPFGQHQVGSSAMPFKRNPINAENMDSLARALAAMPRVAWDNAAHSYLERTLDDSANRRSLLPEAFLIADELLRRAARLFAGLRVDTRASDRLLARYGTFAATERVMMECVRRGGDRQELHEIIREHSLAAWAATADGEENPLPGDLAGDPRLLELATAHELRGWLDARDYVGDAPVRARQIAAAIREAKETLTLRPKA